MFVHSTCSKFWKQCSSGTYVHALSSKYIVPSLWIGFLERGCLLLAMTGARRSRRVESQVA